MVGGIIIGINRRLSESLTPRLMTTIPPRAAVLLREVEAKRCSVWCHAFFRRAPCIPPESVAGGVATLISSAGHQTGTSIKSYFKVSIPGNKHPSTSDEDREINTSREKKRTHKWTHEKKHERSRIVNVQRKTTCTERQPF